MIFADRLACDVVRLTIPKSGYRSDENEDSVSFSRRRGRFAVADGATESSYSRPWARMLADAFVAGAIHGEIAGSLATLQARWAARYLDQPDLPWYAAEKAQAGAYATLLGLTLYPDGSWRCVAVGDSCLFHVHSGAVMSFPLTKPSEFGSRPALVGSRPASNWSLPSAVRHTQGAWRPGDLFVLATDAVSAFLVEECVVGSLEPQDALRLDAPSRRKRRHLDALRRHGRVKNDDLAYLALTLR